MVARTSLSVALLLPLALACSRNEERRSATATSPVRNADVSSPVAPTSGGPRSSAAPATTSGHTTVVIHAGEALTERMAAESAKAKAEGLKPVAYLHAKWCGPCQALGKSMGDPRMEDAFRGTYVLKIDIDDWKGEELARIGLQTRSIPAFMPLDDAGKPNGKIITGAAWGKDVPENMAPPLKKFFAS